MRGWRFADRVGRKAEDGWQVSGPPDTPSTRFADVTSGNQDCRLTPRRLSRDSLPVPRVYDLAMTHLLDSDDLFIHRIQELAAAARLNFFLIEPLWAESFLAGLESGRVHVRVLLNMHSEHHRPDDLYHQLIWSAANHGTLVIDPPAIALAAFDKGLLHPRLLEAGIPVPFTKVVERAEVMSLTLTEAERAALGSPFIIKPGMGYGRRGLIPHATDEGDLTQSLAAFPDARYLLQRRIDVSVSEEGEPLYFRVFHVFGDIWMTWWNPRHDRYRLVSPLEKDRHDLARLEDLVRRLAELTGMRFFSSEIALSPDGPVVIDYINDQCHMLSQSADAQKGAPDELVLGIARRLVDAASGLIRKVPNSPPPVPHPA